MPKETKAFEMLRCEHCGDLKEATRGASSYCGDCRDDSRKTVLICGTCEEREVKDEGEDCPECRQGAWEAAGEAAKDNAVDQAIKSRREEGE